MAVRPAGGKEGEAAEEEVTIFVRAADAAAMADFSKLWTDTVLPAAAAAQGGAAPTAGAADAEGAAVLSEPPAVDRFERPFIGAMRALTKSARRGRAARSLCTFRPLVLHAVHSIGAPLPV